MRRPRPSDFAYDENGHLSTGVEQDLPYALLFLALSVFAIFALIWVIYF